MSNKRKNQEFWEGAVSNNALYRQYHNRLVELSVSVFDWKNMPDTVDTRFLELALLTDGYAVFFYDEDIGYLALRCAIGGQLDVYQIPMMRNAYASNGYYYELTSENSVIIYNNMIHTPSMLDVEIYARRLADIDKTIDVNCKAQKTPVLIQCDETQRLTMKNLYAQYEGNAPVIYGDKNLNPTGIKVLQTGAPFVAPAMYELRKNIWNDALTALGIVNIDQKAERLITGEVQMQRGGTIANRYSRINARRQACEAINKMFGLNISCEYKQEEEERERMEMEKQGESSESESEDKEEKEDE